ADRLPRGAEGRRVEPAAAVPRCCTGRPRPPGGNWPAWAWEIFLKAGARGAMMAAGWPPGRRAAAGRRPRRADQPSQGPVTPLACEAPHTNAEGVRAAAAVGRGPAGACGEARPAAPPPA